MLLLLARPLTADDVDIVDKVSLGGDEDEDAIVIDGGAFDLRPPLLVVTVDMRRSFENGMIK